MLKTYLSSEQSHNYKYLYCNLSGIEYFKLELLSLGEFKYNFKLKCYWVILINLASNKKLLIPT